MKERIYFLDHLRTLAIFFVVVVHAGIVYEQVLENLWIVNDPVKNDSIGLVRMYLDIFIMYLIFFISGYFIPVSIKKKSATEFLKSKVKRILWPWVLAVFTLIPAYKIIFLYSRGLPQEEWYSYFHFFQRTGSDLGFFSNNPNQNWLWFLPILFLFQLLYLAGSKLNLFPLNISLKKAAILTLLIGVIYSMVISSAGLTGWFHSGFFEFQRERLLPYFLVFLLGAVSHQQQVFKSKKNKTHYIIANIVLTLSLTVFTVLALNLFFNLIDPERNFFFISDPIDRTGYYVTALLSMLSLLYVLLYAFRFNFNTTTPLMSLLNKNAYPVYIIHMIVLGIFAWGMLYLPVPAIAKYILLTILTFAGSNFLVYAYDRLLAKKVYLKVATFSLFVIAFFIITGSGNQQKTTTPPTSSIRLPGNISPPAIGLHEAVLKEDITVIRQHIEAGSDLNEREPSGGSSPLITAAVFGKTEAALLLIEAGANVNFQNNEGSTPLHSAAFFCRIPIVKALLANGADQGIKNKAGSTALDSVKGPFTSVKGIYDYFQQTFGSLGLQLDYEQIQKDRSKVIEILESKK